VGRSVTGFPVGFCHFPMSREQAMRQNSMLLRIIDLALCARSRQSILWHLWRSFLVLWAIHLPFSSYRARVHGSFSMPRFGSYRSAFSNKVSKYLCSSMRAQDRDSKVSTEPP
jgi:hypothetical protein